MRDLDQVPTLTNHVETLQRLKKALEESLIYEFQS